MRLRWYLTDLTVASHFPPKWGALGGLKIHYVPSFASKSDNFSDSFDVDENKFRNSLSAPIRLVPQSLDSVAQIPRLAAKRLYAAMKASEE